MISTGAAEGEAFADGDATPKHTESNDCQNAHGGPTNSAPRAFRGPKQPNAAIAAPAVHATRLRLRTSRRSGRTA
jgi:hypothetical protein